MFARGSARYLTVTLGGFALLLLLAILLDPRVWILVALATPVVALVTWFFRDPERTIGADVVSPADGRVIAVRDDDVETRLTIFMSPIDVHVNRAPLDGTITSLEYHQGSHVPAFRKESDRNERLELELSTPRGIARIRLIAGTVARRIHPYLAPGVAVKKGDRIGLIAFGSRCELVFPPKQYRLTVSNGQTVKAGRTTVAKEV